MEKKTIRLANGETYAYLEAGTGDSVLLIHGNMSSSVHFSPIFGALAQKYRVIAPDLRGFGDSSYEKRFDLLSELAEDVKLFCEALGIARAHVAGWSTGGGIALELAARFPALVRSLFSIEGAGHRGYPIYKKDEKNMPLVGQVYASKEEMAKDPLQVAPMLALFAAGNAAGMGWVWDQTIYTVGKPLPEQSALWLAETMKQRNLIDLDWALANLNMGAGTNGYREGDNSISKVECPCAFTTCDRDVVVPEWMVAENVGALGFRAKLLRYEGSGHSPLVDCPDRLTADMLAFFGEN